MDLHRASWRKSSFSQLSSCVEVAYVDGRVALRDSKDQGGPVLTFDADEWAAFLAKAREGHFDPPRKP